MSKWINEQTMQNRIEWKCINTISMDNNAIGKKKTEKKSNANNKWMNDTLGWRERLNDLISYYDDDDNDDIWNRLRDEKKKIWQSWIYLYFNEAEMNNGNLWISSINHKTTKISNDPKKGVGAVKNDLNNTSWIVSYLLIYQQKMW